MTSRSLCLFRAGFHRHHHQNVKLPSISITMSISRAILGSGMQEGHRHVRIHPECSLCGCYFDVGDPMVACKYNVAGVLCHCSMNLTIVALAVLGDRSKPSCQVIDASTFPMAIYCNQRHGTPWTFCQFPKCAKCAAELESVTVHRDCFQLFLQETAAHKNIGAYNLCTRRTHAILGVVSGRCPTPCLTKTPRILPWSTPPRNG